VVQTLDLTGTHSTPVEAHVGQRFEREKKQRGGGQISRL